MSDYGLRFRLQADSASHDAELVHELLFETLDEVGVGEDISPIDGAGRFNLWLTVTAASPEEALSVGIRHLASAVAARTGSNNPITLKFLSAEIEIDDSDDLSRQQPLLAAI